MLVNIAKGGSFSSDRTIDPLYQMMFMMMNMLMEMEASKITGSEKGEHNSNRTDYRSGTRERRFDTRLGTFNLQIPKFRNTGYVPFFMQNKQRSEEALISMVVEAYTNGVSTRKIKHLAESLGIENISAGEVSTMNKNLDEMVKAFQEQPLESEMPVLWIDAVYEKIRVGKHVKSIAVMIVKTINKCWLGSVWQRCKVHFMRNIMATVPKKQKEAFGADLKKIWQAETKEDAIKLKDAFVEKYAEKFDKAVECLEEGFEDSIQYYGFSKIDSKKISSTNTLERLNKEVRRRSRAVGIFPSTESYLRLMTASLIEYSEDHLTGASYISAETLREQKIEWEKEVENYPYFKTIKSLIPDECTRWFYLDCVNDSTKGYASSLTRTLQSIIYGHGKEFFQNARDFNDEKHHLLETGLLEIEKNEDIEKTRLTLSDKSLELLYGENADLYKTKNQMKNVLQPEEIKEKHLFYEADIQNQIEMLSNSLSQEHLSNIQKRLEEKGLPKGVAVILYGAPGTGKTETVYQLAKKQTEK